MKIDIIQRLKLERKLREIDSRNPNLQPDRKVIETVEDSQAALDEWSAWRDEVEALEVELETYGAVVTFAGGRHQIHWPR